MHVAHCIHEGSVIHRHADEIGSVCHQSRCYRDRERPGDFIEFKSIELQQYLDRQLPTKKIFLRGKNNRRVFLPRSSEPAETGDAVSAAF